MINDIELFNESQELGPCLGYLVRPRGTDVPHFTYHAVSLECQGDTLAVRDQAGSDRPTINSPTFHGMVVAVGTDERVQWSQTWHSTRVSLTETRLLCGTGLILMGRIPLYGSLHFWDFLCNKIPLNIIFIWNGIIHSWMKKNPLNRIRISFVNQQFLVRNL